MEYWVLQPYNAPYEFDTAHLTKMENYQQKNIQNHFILSDLVLQIDQIANLFEATKLGFQITFNCWGGLRFGHRHREVWNQEAIFVLIFLGCLEYFSSS